MARLLATAVLLASTLVSGCLDNNGPNPGQQIFEASLAQWNSDGPASYDMVLRRQTISINPDLRVLITVRNGVVTSRFYFETDIPVAPADVEKFPDVPGLFDFVAEGMAGDPFLLATTYDELYGYPSEIQYDLTASSTSDNLIYTVVEFTPIE
jgi:hypothetical protein